MQALLSVLLQCKIIGVALYVEVWAPVSGHKPFPSLHCNNLKWGNSLSHNILEVGRGVPYLTIAVCLR